MVMVFTVDPALGRVVEIETLGNTGQLDHTLILFTGDNGGEENLSLTYHLHGFEHEPFDGVDLVPYLKGDKARLHGRLYVNPRTLNHRYNNWHGGKDTDDKSTGSCFALIADDYKLMKLFQNIHDRSRFS